MAGRLLGGGGEPVVVRCALLIERFALRVLRVCWCGVLRLTWLPCAAVSSVTAIFDPLIFRRAFGSLGLSLFRTFVILSGQWIDDQRPYFWSLRVILLVVAACVTPALSFALWRETLGLMFFRRLSDSSAITDPNNSSRLFLPILLANEAVSGLVNRKLPAPAICAPPEPTTTIHPGICFC
jgi:hypothetical protein